jgi:hypothetical protein
MGVVTFRSLNDIAGAINAGYSMYDSGQMNDLTRSGGCMHVRLVAQRRHPKEIDLGGGAKMATPIAFDASYLVERIWVANYSG